MHHLSHLAPESQDEVVEGVVGVHFERVGVLVVQTEEEEVELKLMLDLAEI